MNHSVPHAAYRTAPHATHYTKAIEAIQRHGLMATITLDGVLALGAGEWSSVEPDTFIDVPMVFPVDDAGMVPSAMVRTWLGY